MERGKEIMGTTTRPELSEKNKYWISRHRYYELKHFCLQYPIWKKAYASLDGLSKKPDLLTSCFTTTERGDPTERCAEARQFYLDKIEIIESSAKEANPDFYMYILKAVTEDISYTCLHTKYEIPFGKDMYYEMYRKFFWILSSARK